MAPRPRDNTTPPGILVIDDNPTIHEAFDSILRSDPPNQSLEADEALMFGDLGEDKVAAPVYAIDHALSGQDGVEKIRQALAAERPYQVAFVDIRMPGIDGVETIRQMWELDTRVQTVICTAYSDYRWEDLTQRFGPTDRLLVLRKPFHDIEVKQLASTLVHKWRLGRQAAVQREQMERLVAQRTKRLLEFHRRDHQRLHDLDEAKVHYLVKLAQEFRGPLTLILNPLEDMLKGVTPDRQQQELICRHARGLLRLADDALLVRRFELDKTLITVQQRDVVAFVRGVAQGFAAGARQRGVQVDFYADEEQRLVWIDAARLEQVLFTLLSRALDAAGEKGWLTVQLRTEGGQIRIILEAGTGRRAEGATGTGAENTGPADRSPLESPDVALLLLQQTLQAMNGSVVFHTTKAARPGETSGMRVEVEVPSARPASSAAPASDSEKVAAPAEPPTAEKELPVILLVEESPDLRTFIRQGLGADYRVLETASSTEGLAAARESVPDLLVIGSESSQPDSLALCAQLKRDQLTSHIPIILLTLDNSDSLQVKALEAGVDDCLAKPFRLLLLRARVDNLLETRRKLHEHFQQLNSVQPRELASNNVDAEFLRRVVEMVEKNLADHHFDMETLARQLGVSRRQLFRKFKALAGCTPNVFIRDIRLKCAAQLLRESRLTVAEIVYVVGFSDPKYFRTVFRERFGVLPGDYPKV